MFLTKEVLQTAGVDPEQVQKFSALFPNGAQVTRDLCVIHAQKLNFGRMAKPLLSNASYAIFRDKIKDTLEEYRKEARKAGDMYQQHLSVPGILLNAFESATRVTGKQDPLLIDHTEKKLLAIGSYYKESGFAFGACINRFAFYNEQIAIAFYEAGVLRGWRPL